jgi:dipeptidyl aminopeptidase/acylaminoacyl peptidase
MSKCLLALMIAVMLMLGLASGSQTWIPGGVKPVQGQNSLRNSTFDPLPVQIPANPEPDIARRPITNMDLLTIRDPRGVEVSPDGKSVAFVVSQAVYDTNGYRTGLFVVGTEPGSKVLNLGSAGPPHWDLINQFQTEPPHWSPDSRYVTYRLKRDGAWQVWKWNRDGGEPVQLTHSSCDVRNYEWAADGSKIMFNADKSYDTDEALRLSERGFLYDGSIHPWENKSIVEQELEHERNKTEAWTHDVATGKEVKGLEDEKSSSVARLKASDNRGAPRGTISPDGRLTAYLKPLVDKKTSHDRWSLFIRRLNDESEIEATPDVDYVDQFWWSTDSKKIFYLVQSTDGRASKLCVVWAEGGEKSQLVEFDGRADEFSVDKAGRLAACVRQSLTKPREVAVVDLTTGIERTLVNLNPEFHSIQLSSVGRIEWKDKYGEIGYGYLAKPLNYEKGKIYPLVVTTYRSGDYFLRGASGDEYPIQVFAAQGFAVLAFDIGSFPHVKEGDFSEALRQWEGPMASLEAALRVLETMGIIDPHRTALTGLSRGAEIVEFTISHSSLFQVAITSGPSGRDPFFYYIGGKEWHERFAKLGLSGWPEGAASVKWHELSPALNANHVTAPLLVNAADSEFRAGLQLYTSLEELHKPIELFIYPDELHIKNQPKHRSEIYERNLDWLRFWLKGEQDTDPQKRSQYVRWEGLRKLTASSAGKEELVTGKN